MAKKSAVKTITIPKIWGNSDWIVRFGRLNAGPGAAGGVKRLFRVVGEKIPFEAINLVNKHLRSQGVRREGLYVAHDSMGYARYIGRGRIFSRLRACRNVHQPEVKYFSFYVVEEKKHEREIETLLIHVAGPLLQFNTRKKRVTISAGSLNDYEAGTLFFQRGYKKGKKPKRKRRPAGSHS
jgi:hypothetical protein